MRRALLLCTALTAFTVPVLAQDESASEADDKSRLENWLQSTLSGAGRDVTVTGFSGALSSEATMGELTIADDDGVWLRLSGVTLDWTRSAVLTGRIAINELVATEIELVRLPASSGGPSAEASDFSLPDLPVSINIGELSARRVILGEAVLGEAAELRIDGSAALADGEGKAEFTAERIDGAEGLFSLAGSYSNATTQLSIDLDLQEGQDGIVARTINLPGAPALDLRVTGDDPLSDFTAAVLLSTDGEDRLAGEIHVAAADTATEGDLPAKDTILEANLAGDLRPLFEASYQPFFGGESLLHLEATRYATGATRIEDLFLKTGALDLRGHATINDKGWAEQAMLTGSVGRDDGEPVVLPAGGSPTRVGGIALDFNYDSRQGTGWTGRLDVTDLSRDDLTLAHARIAGAGELEPGETGVTPNIGGRVTLSLAGLEMADEALDEALGRTVAGSLTFAKVDQEPLSFSNISLAGESYGLGGNVTLSTNVEQLDLVAGLDLSLAAEDLSRFAQLAGIDLSGAATLGIEGEAAVPGGPFDLVISGDTRDLDLGIEQLDGLFSGDGTLSVSADRTLERTRISAARITAPGVQLDASATLAEEASQIEAVLDLPDGTRLDPALKGALTLSATAVQTAGDWTIDADAAGPGGLSADITGGVEAVRSGFGPVTAQVILKAESLAPYAGLAGRDLSGAADMVISAEGDLTDESFSVSATGTGTNLAFGLVDIDRLFAGASTIDLAARRDADGLLTLERLDLDTPEITAEANGTSQDGQSVIDFNTRLARVDLLVPGLPGAFSASGQAVLTGEDYQVDLTGAGPGGMRVAVNGSISGDASTGDLAINGSAPLALANGFIQPNQLDGTAGFDLRLNGPLTLASLSGTVNTSGSRLSLPTLKFALRNLGANVTLSNGRARVEVSSGVTSGGRLEVAGPIGLTAPYSADLAVRLQNLGLTDPSLYDTKVTGDLTVSGPLTGGARIAGRIETSAVEIRIPSTGFSVVGDLEGLQHVNESAPSQRTRTRAGKTGEGSTGSGPAYPLDVVVNVPNQVFIRGRGLDAELGGRIRLRGTTANVVPQGALSLIRGRLDLLGNRLDITEASASLQGSMDPFIRVVASTEVEDTAIRVVIDGPASSPTVSFTSSPELPEDEVLARLIFGRALSDISALQALKLANAVAQLSGRSGSGVVGNLREGFGLSDLDVSSDEDGNLAVSAGAYVTENVYTGVEVGADGSAEVSINLDLSRNVTARGSVNTEGETALGVYFEKDY